MNRMTAVSLTCAIILLVIMVDAQTTQTDWVRGTDFSQFHTFTWATGAHPIQDPDLSLGLARALQDELEGKNVHFVSPQQKFDVFVTYNAQINPDRQDSSRHLITVSLLIFDSRNNAVVWRAGGHVPLVKDKEQNRRNVRGLLAAMFQKYPPSE